MRATRSAAVLRRHAADLLVARLRIVPEEHAEVHAVGRAGHPARRVEIVRIVRHLVLVDLVELGHHHAVVVHEQVDVRRILHRALVDGARVDRAALQDPHEAESPVLLAPRAASRTGAPAPTRRSAPRTTRWSRRAPPEAG